MDEDFFRFTSGRWLWDEEPRLYERYKKFNVRGLQQIAAASVGAQQCLSMLKIAEGGSNRIFRLKMDNGKAVIARIPYPIHGSTLHSVASEVATMDFASEVLDIPIPRILAWDAKSDNAAGTEFMLMEEALGAPLHKTWNSLELNTKSDLVEELVSISQKLLSASFSRYGSLYFSDDRIPGCQALGLTGNLPPLSLERAEERYMIGPIAESSFWDGERNEFDGVRGPWTAPSDYVKAVANREIRWLRDFANAKEHRQVYGNITKAATSDLIALQHKLLTIAEDILSKEPEFVRPTIWHWDLHAPNIFVDGNKITAVIDWQDAWVGPLLLHNLRPRLLDFQGESMLRLPPDYKSITDKEEKRKLCTQVEKSLLLWSFQTPLERDDPALKRVLHLPQRDMIRDAILFAANTWESGAVPFREVLMRIRRNWNHFRLDEPCPFDFTEEERATHEREGEGFNEKADFWSSISHKVTREGYVANEDYDEVLEMFRQLREQGLEVLREDEKEDFERATRWAAR